MNWDSAWYVDMNSRWTHKHEYVLPSLADNNGFHENAM